MFVNSDVNLIAHRSGDFSIIIGNEEFHVESSSTELANSLTAVYNEVMNSGDRNSKFFEALARPEHEELLNQLVAVFHNYDFTTYVMAVNPSISVGNISGEDVVKNGLSQLIDFFKEFQFEPNFRFVNTLSHALASNADKAKSYICSYFELTDNPYKNEISAKMCSKEFKNLLSKISVVKPTHTINNRFKLYYGSQGTGKTTIAQTETDKRCVVCNSSMLPADLMEDFTFDNGNATFKPSALWNCMEQGKPIVFDEINLLPFDSLRFLQGILDGKTEFSYKGNTVHINDGFAIIGTMNLTVNGMTYGLPEPLIDRCAEMRKFSLTPDVLLSAIC